MRHKKYKFIIEVNGLISSKAILQEVYNSDYYIAVYPKIFRDHLSTKFPELLAVGTPVIYIGSNGDIANFIENNNMGVIFSEEDFGEDLRKLLISPIVKRKNSRNEFSISDIVGETFTSNLLN